MNNGRDLTPFGNRRASSRCNLSRGKQTQRRRLHVVHKDCGGSGEIEIKARGFPGETTKTLAGAVIGDLDIFTRRELMLPSDLQGILVHHVAENSPAHKAGLRRGDIITEVNCSPVRNADQALSLAEASRDARILLEVWTEKGFRHLTIQKP